MIGVRNLSSFHKEKQTHILVTHAKKETFIQKKYVMCRRTSSFLNKDIYVKLGQLSLIKDFYLVELPCKIYE